MSTKIHIISKENSERKFCGDHYCTGHVDTTLVCSCGFSQPYYGNDHYKETVQEHKLNLILTELGIVFEA